MDDIHGFTGSLTGLSGERIQIMGYMTLEITFGDGLDTKSINVSYLMVDTLTPFNIILGCLVINAIEDQQVARECYLSSLEESREGLALVDANPFEVPNTNFEGWDLRSGAETE